MVITFVQNKAGLNEFLNTSKAFTCLLLDISLWIKLIRDEEDLFSRPKCSAMTAELFNVTFLSYAVGLEKLHFGRITTCTPLKEIKKFYLTSSESRREKLLTTEKAFITIA